LTKICIPVFAWKSCAVINGGANTADVLKTLKYITESSEADLARTLTTT
jgi:hypothetical protein